MNHVTIICALLAMNLFTSHPSDAAMRVRRSNMEGALKSVEGELRRISMKKGAFRAK